MGEEIRLSAEEMAALIELLEDDTVAEEIVAILTATDSLEKLGNALTATQRLVACEGFDEEFRGVMRAAVDELLDPYVEETGDEEQS